jgi:ubiquitin C-terminal hydrolase
LLVTTVTSQTLENALRQLLFAVYLLPSTLIFHLNRVLNDEVNRHNGNVSFPFEADIGTMLSLSAKKYHLKGIVLNSHNDWKSGHYKIVLKINKVWIECDDNLVKKVSQKEVE